MSDNNVFGEVLEQAGTVVKQTGKAAANVVSDFAQGAAAQVGIPVPDNSSAGPADASLSVSNQDVVESLYKKSQAQAPAPQQTVSNSFPQTTTTDQSQKSPEELANLELVRKNLHNEYFQRDFNRPQQEEERVAEKIEREDQQENFELQKKQMEKPPELQRAAQRVEVNPGASG